MPSPIVPPESAVLKTCHRWEITIPGWRPASLNELMSCYWAKAGRLKKTDRDHVTFFGRMARVPPATGKRRISLGITLPPRKRRWDIDALQKSTLDACKHAGLIRDDNPKWAEWGGVTYSRGTDFSTVIVVEDVAETCTGRPID